MTAPPASTSSPTGVPWLLDPARAAGTGVELRPDIRSRSMAEYSSMTGAREGISRDEYLTKKFGSPERYKSIADASPPPRRRRARLQCRQDCAPAEHARLPPADPVGAQHRRLRQDETAADGALFHRGRRPHRPRSAGEGRGDCGMTLFSPASSWRRPRRRSRHAGSRKAKQAASTACHAHLRRRARGVGAQDPATRPEPWRSG